MNDLAFPLRRRWYQYRLRSLVILIALLAIPMGWLSWELRQSRQRQESIDWIQEMGGMIEYEGGENPGWWRQVRDKCFGRLPRTVNQIYRSNLTSWLGASTNLKDISPLARLTSVRELYISKNDVSDLSPLGKMKNLEVLNANSCPIEDLSPLADLTRLRELHLMDTGVVDLSPLANLTHLEELHLDSLSYTDDQVKELRAMLPNCQIVVEE